MNHVVGVFGDPDFGFPGDVGDEFLHCAAVFEGGDENGACLATGEQVFEFLATFAIHGAGTGHGFNEEEPVLGAVVDDDIGNLGGGVQGDTERGKACGFQVDEFVLSVADVEDLAAGGEGGAELLDDGLDKRILAAGRQSDMGCHPAR